MLVALQFPALMAGKLADHSLRNSFKEKDGCGHVAQVVDAERAELLTRTVTGGLKTVADIPAVRRLPHEADVAAVGWKNVLIPAVTRELLQGLNSDCSKGQSFRSPILCPRYVNVGGRTVKLNLIPAPCQNLALSGSRCAGQDQE